MKHNVNVEWHGKKFVQKNLDLFRMNTRELSSKSSICFLRTTVTKQEATQKLFVNVEKYIPTTTTRATTTTTTTTTTSTTITTTTAVPSTKALGITTPRPHISFYEGINFTGHINMYSVSKRKQFFPLRFQILVF
uniref:Uncharacterized protein n=1 Tax=Panagrolaimus davidi TaxID=227884 RepID=A0A914P0F7_9BILA